MLANGQTLGSLRLVVPSNPTSSHKYRCCEKKTCPGGVAQMLKLFPLWILNLRVDLSLSLMQPFSPLPIYPRRVFILDNGRHT